MSKLIINSTIVPAEISRANLAGKIISDQEIKQTYQNLKDQALARSAKTATPCLTLIFGSSGTGVKTLVEQNYGPGPDKICNPVIADAENMAAALPSFRDNAMHVQNDYGSGSYNNFSGHNGGAEKWQEAMQRLTKQFLPIGRYMQDRLMTEAWEDGYNVLVAKRGRSLGGVELVKAIERVRANLHAILYTAPLSQKLRNVSERMQTHSGIILSREDMEKEHHNGTGLMPGIAEAVQKGLLSLHFRIAEDNQQSSTLVAEAKNGNYRITNQTRALLFNGYHLDSGMSVASLMGNREPISAEERALRYA